MRGKGDDGRNICTYELLGYDLHETSTVSLSLRDTLLGSILVHYTVIEPDSVCIECIRTLTKSLLVGREDDFPWPKFEIDAGQG